MFYVLYVWIIKHIRVLFLYLAHLFVSDEHFHKFLKFCIDTMKYLNIKASRTVWYRVYNL